MKKFFVEQGAIYESTITISGAQHEHLSKVLRFQAGNQIVCVCGNQFEYLCQIEDVAKKQTTAKILEKRLCTANPKFEIAIFQGLAKGEKLDLITQKTTELGASKLVMFESEFTIAKNNHTKIERLKKITQEACKQCGRSVPLEILDTIPLKNINNFLSNFDLVLFFYEKADPKLTLNTYCQEIVSAKKIAIIVGAEGGFSEKENNFLCNLGVKQVCLGERILRTETASIAITSFISFLKNN